MAAPVHQQSIKNLGFEVARGYKYLYRIAYTDIFAGFQVSSSYDLATNGSWEGKLFGRLARQAVTGSFQLPSGRSHQHI
jgi:hypothetical protein